jgi:GNAT superfamily N-acetyltransferase
MQRKYSIRELKPECLDQVELIARRMQSTLVEVLGEERGSSMYTIDWLVHRVLWHLDSAQVIGQVFIAENDRGEMVGHTIVRLEKEADGPEIGLFSTTFVTPGSRRSGVAQKLLNRGEEWMLEKGIQEAVTYTDRHNLKLQKLYLGYGYCLSEMPNEFVKLSKSL